MEIDPKAGPAAAGAIVRTALPVSTSPGALATPPPAPAPSKDPAALKAAATGGQAGLTAYQQSLKNLDSMQAAALQNAQARASLIGGPEAQGFEALPNQYFDRARTNLQIQQGGFQGQQDANRKAFDKYFGQLKGDMGAINDYIKTTLGGYEAKKRAKAEATLANKFPLDEILGETEYGLPGAQKAAADAKTVLDNYKTQAAARTPGVKNGSVDMLDQQRHAVQDVLARQTQEFYAKGTSPERKATLVTQMQKNKERLAKVEGLEREQVETDKKLRATDEAKIAELQADYDKKAALTDPAAYARNIAVGKYGQDPMKAAGKLTPDKFYPKAQSTADTMKYGEQAVGLAQKLDIKGGAKRVSEVLGDKEVQDDLNTLEDWAQSGKYSLDDVKKEMGKAYLSTSDPGDRDKYNVIIEMVARLPWKARK